MVREFFKIRKTPTLKKKTINIAFSRDALSVAQTVLVTTQE